MLSCRSCTLAVGAQRHSRTACSWALSGGACLYSRFGRCCTDPLQRCRSVNSAALSSTSAAAGVAAMTQACACVFRAAARATRKARYGRASAGSPSVSSFVCSSTARYKREGSGQQSRAHVKLRRGRWSSPVERRQAAARRCRRAQRGVCEPLMGWDDVPARMPPVGEVVRPCESDIRQAAPVPQRRSTDLSRRRADLFLILWRPPRGKQERRRGAGSASACAPARKQRRSGVRQAIARTRLDPEREAAPRAPAPRRELPPHLLPISHENSRASAWPCL